MNISNKTIEVLKEAGWYEGRKIDISENVKFLEERGFEVFESAKRFMEQFKEVIGVLDSRAFGLSKYIEDEVIPVGALHNFGTDLYIYIYINQEKCLTQ